LKDSVRYLYFIVVDDFPGVVKVGSSYNPLRRLNQFRNLYYCPNLQLLRKVKFPNKVKADKAEDTLKKLLNETKCHYINQEILDHFVIKNTSIVNGMIEWYKLTHTGIHALADLFM